MITSRRSFFLGASAFLAAPSIVRVASLMPVSVLRDAPCIETPIVYEPPAAFMYAGTKEPDFIAPAGSIYIKYGRGGSDGDTAFILTSDGWHRLYPDHPFRDMSHPSVTNAQA